MQTPIQYGALAQDRQMPPTGLTATAGNTTITLSWTAPSSDGGSAITNYKYSTDNGTTYTAFDPAVTDTAATITGLTNGTEYQIKLRAVNALGNGVESAAVSATPVIQKFKLHSNEVTVECTDANVGDTGAINGHTYTKRTKEQITEANAATTCTSGITDMSGIFGFAEAFNGDISNWDVSSVTYMINMFYRAIAFNGDISEWDVSSVTNMDYMFDQASAFNQNLSSWCVTNITSEPFRFGNAGTDPVWGTCPGPPDAPHRLNSHRRQYNDYVVLDGTK